MTRIELEPGDTLGGTAPLVLLHRVRAARPRTRKAPHRRRRRRIWFWVALMAIGAAAAPHLV